MKASELVTELCRMIEEHGDLMVWVDVDWNELPVSQVEYRDEYRQGIERMKADTDQVERFVI